MSRIIKSSAISKFYRPTSLKNLSKLIALFHTILTVPYPTWIVYFMDSLESCLWTRTHPVTKQEPTLSLKYGFSLLKC